MDDGYIKVRDLLDFCDNQNEHSITPNDIMRMNRVGWISVKDRMPAETHSIFFPWYGKKEWTNAMWHEQSDEVLVTVAFKDGTKMTATGRTHDGAWHTSISRTLEPVVTHWMPLPEPPKEE